MKVATFYADADLPAEPRRKQTGFDWRWAITQLQRTARAALGADTVVVTDWETRMHGAVLRTGNARSEGIMLWLLDAQAAAIRASREPLLMVSPDTLIAGPLDVLFGDWDVCLLTRARPTPIINSVIAVQPRQRVLEFWLDVALEARRLPETSRQWGADIDALVQALDIKPREDGIRDVHGIRFRFMPVDGIFQSIELAGPAQRLPVPIWDFKGARKARMQDYAELL